MVSDGDRRESFGQNALAYAAKHHDRYKNLLLEYASQLTFRLRGSNGPFQLIDPE